MGIVDRTRLGIASVVVGAVLACAGGHKLGSCAEFWTNTLVQRVNHIYEETPYSYTMEEIRHQQHDLRYGGYMTTIGLGMIFGGLVVARTPPMSKFKIDSGTEVGKSYSTYGKKPHGSEPYRLD
jgi:hypothetical protein